MCLVGSWLYILLCGTTWLPRSPVSLIERQEQEGSREEERKEEEGHRAAGEEAAGQKRKRGKPCRGTEGAGVSVAEGETGTGCGEDGSPASCFVCHSEVWQ